MSAKVSGWVWDQDIPAQCKCVLLWLAERATENGVCFPGQDEIRRKTRLSESMVRRYLRWAADDQDRQGNLKPALVRIIERPVAGARNTSNVYVLLVPWAKPEGVRRELEELRYVPRAALKGVGVTGAPQGVGWQACTPVGGTGAPQVGGTGDREEPSLPDRNREQPPVSPPNEWQQQGVIGVETTPSGDSAQTLSTAFYRGLGAADSAVTASIRRRDLVIALQLVEAGATAAEAEAYAQEMSSASGRMAPVDLRSFERERLGWLARRRGRDLTARNLVDRTGQPPSWQAQAPTTEVETTAAAAVRPTAAAAVTDTPGLAGAQLGDKLRTLLRQGGAEGQ